MSEPADGIPVDARELAPPEPLENVRQTPGLLRPGQSIRLRLLREPFPRYPLLAERGDRHVAEMGTDGSDVILIHPVDGAAGAR